MQSRRFAHCKLWICLVMLLGQVLRPWTASPSPGSKCTARYMHELVRCIFYASATAWA